MRILAVIVLNWINTPLFISNMLYVRVCRHKHFHLREPFKHHQAAEVLSNIKVQVEQASTDMARDN